MTKNDIQNIPDYYIQYVSKVSDGSFDEIFENEGIDCYLDRLEDLEKVGDEVYAEGKWTIKQLVQHLIDCDRIFLNRALRFLRNDTTELPGFDETLYAESARVDHKSLESLLEELQIVRLSAWHLFKDLTEEEWQRTGTANGKTISVLAIAFIIIGHAKHHFDVIEERYMSLGN